MLIRIALLLAIFLAQPGLAQEFVRYPGQSPDLDSRWQWSQQAAAGDRAWIGWQFTTRVDEKLLAGVGQGLQHGYYRQAGLSINAHLAGLDNQQQAHIVASQLVLLMNTENGVLRHVELTRASRPLSLEAPVYWLGEVSSDSSYRQLVSLLDEAQSGHVKTGLIMALGMHDHSDRTAYLDSLRRTPAWQSLAADLLRALSLQHSPAVESLLLEVAGDQGQAPRLRRIATTALRGYGSDISLNLLLELAQTDRDSEVREEAVQSLAYFPAEQVRQVLHDLAWFDGSASIRREAVQSLGRLREAQANDLMLTIAREHPSADTREEALEQLQRRLF